MAVGTYTIADLLEFRNRSVVEFGEDVILETVRRELEAHNRLWLTMMDRLATMTTDAQRQSGRGGSMEFREADELARLETQKTTRGQTLGFPLRNYQLPVGWTGKFMRLNTPADVAEITLKIQEADVENTYRRMRIAFYNPTNYTAFDEWQEQINLDVKALYNADGWQIPDGFNGETFDGSTHTHYTASTTLDVADIRAMVQNIEEHDPTAVIDIEINKANRDAFLALSGVLPVDGPLINRGANTDTVTIEGDRTRNPSNEPVGVLDGRYVIYTKPYTVAGYAHALKVSEKPLTVREHRSPLLRGLRIDGEDEAYPLRAEFYEHMFGIAVSERDAAAVHQFNASVDDVYEVPSL